MTDTTRVAVAAATDRGRTRSRNEDAVIGVVWTGPDPAAPAVVLAVADGMGGSAGGDVASTVAIETVETSLRGRIAAGALPDSDAWLEAIGDLFARAGEALRARAAQEPDLARMATTLTCLAVDRGRIVFGHVGDCRAFLFRAGVLRQLTTDHNAAADLVAEGRLSPADAGSHRSRYILTRWLRPSGPAGAGPEQPEPPELGCLAIAAGDVLLVCSDGLHGLVSDADITAVLAAAAPAAAGGLDTTAAALIARANANGGTDNISVALAACIPS